MYIEAEKKNYTHKKKFGKTGRNKQSDIYVNHHWTQLRTDKTTTTYTYIVASLHNFVELVGKLFEKDFLAFFVFLWITFGHIAMENVPNLSVKHSHVIIEEVILFFSPSTTIIALIPGSATNKNQTIRRSEM